MGIQLGLILPRTFNQAYGYTIKEERGGSIFLTSVLHGRLQDLTWNWLQGNHSHLSLNSLKPLVENLTYHAKGLDFLNRAKDRGKRLPAWPTAPICTHSSLHTDKFLCCSHPPPHQAPWKESMKHGAVNGLDNKTTFQLSKPERVSASPTLPFC